MTGTRHPGGIATVAAFRPWRSSRPPAIRPGHHKHRQCRCPAEREGFEPSVRVNAHTLSKRAPSATQTPLLRFALVVTSAKREEREGFEPSVGGRPTLDFESSAFNHSATSPYSFAHVFSGVELERIAAEYERTLVAEDQPPPISDG
jgi:hypothetical protein